MTDQETVLRRFFAMGQAFDRDASTFDAIDESLRRAIEAPVNERAWALLGWLLGWLLEPFMIDDRHVLVERVVDVLMFPLTHQGCPGRKVQP